VPIHQSKKAAILGLLERPDGAAISDLTAASVRAALTCHRAPGRCGAISGSSTALDATNRLDFRGRRSVHAVGRPRQV
jgi:hypothetical protein